MKPGMIARLLRRLSLSAACQMCLGVMFGSANPAEQSSTAAQHATMPSPVSPSSLDQGVATFEVTARSAKIWVRSERHPEVHVHVFEEKGSLSNLQGIYSLALEPMHDHIGILHLKDLKPATAYIYQILEKASEAESRQMGASLGAGRFATPPDERGESDQVRFVWSGDLGGQGFCRKPEAGYTIFDQMLNASPDFALFIGDMIYADSKCASPPNITGSDFVASSLEQYRLKHRYQREDPALRRFLSHVPVYAIWDDHEVRNDFSGLHEPLMPDGQQAFAEYWGGVTDTDNRHRFYRKIARGPDLDLFILDTRQYRSANQESDGETKTMLGMTQLEWLIRELRASLARWKIVVSSVPLSIPKYASPGPPVSDSWARDKGEWGFHYERARLVDALLARHVRNVVWLTGDVHFAQMLAYDPNGDGKVDFHECTAGPLSASVRAPMARDETLHPTVLYEGGGFFNFGQIDVEGTALRVRIIDSTGETRFSHTIVAE